MKSQKKRELWRRNIPLILMSLPAVTLMFMFTYMPKFGLILAFKDYNYVDGLLGSAWNGLENFKYVFASGDVWVAVRNTVLYHTANVFVLHFIALLLAIMLYVVSKKSAKRSQFVISMPYLVSMNIIASVVYIFLRYDGGIVNSLRDMMGMEAIGWYITPKIWPFLLVFVNTWFGAGIKSVYYYSIFMGIDQTLFEAISIDGGGAWCKFRHVMWPAVTPILCLFTITEMGHLLSSSLALYHAVPMDSSALYKVTEVLATYEYHGLQMGNIGTTAALGLVVGVVQLIAVQALNSIVKKVSPGNEMY